MLSAPQFFLLCVCFPAVLPARILCIHPVPSISHHFVHRALTRELVKRGHELVIITTDPVYPKNKAPINITEIDVHDISHSMWEKGLEVFAQAESEGRIEIVDHWDHMFKFFFTIFDAQMKQDNVKALINDRKQHFDLILVDAVAQLSLAFRHRFKAPVIAVSTFYAAQFNLEAMGSPTHPYFYPEMYKTKLEMDFWDRATMVYRHLKHSYLNWENLHIQNEIARRHFGKDMPSIEEIPIDMLFVNAHQVWEGIRPIPPSVVYTGGMHLKPAEPLPKDLAQWLDESSQGVVYMSLGCNVKSKDLPEDKVRFFLRVFSELPQRVLWKWEADKLPGRPDNVRISKWLPQPDVLRHPNMKLFITQGGLQSIDEAINSGVPIIGIPFIADQELNVDRLRHYGLGLALDIKTLDENSLRSAILEILANNTYRDNVSRLARLVNDQPMGGLARAVWWTEYVLRHAGARHLRSPAAAVSAARYYMLDLAALVGALAVAVVVACIVVAYCFCNMSKIGLKEKTS